MTTILAQLSDLHIREPGELAYGRVDTAAYTRGAVESILRLRQRPQAVVVTGDLVDFGGDAEYRHLAQLLGPLAMPVYLLPGNHDDRAALRRAFPTHAYLGDGGFVQYSVEIGDAALIALDTTEPWRSEGRLCPDRLAWLAGELERRRGQRTLIAMHHPPFRTLIGHMDEIGLLEGSEALEALLSRHPQVQRVICGHLHRAIDVSFGGAIASTSPSPAHQVCLDLDEDAASAWSLEPPAFRLHAWSGTAQVVTHLAFCGEFDGPYPFHGEDGTLIR